MSLSFLTGEEEKQYTDLELAWLTLDWDKIQEFADELKEKPENELFSVINDINTGKKERNVNTIDSYSKYFIDGHLCGFTDCIHHVYMSNMLLSGMSNQAHYNYLKTAIPHGKRFAKKEKLVVDIKHTFYIKMIMSVYPINKYDAEMYLNIMVAKNSLSSFLSDYKSIVTDEFLKSVTKNVKEQKELKKLL